MHASFTFPLTLFLLAAGVLLVGSSFLLILIAVLIILLIPLMQGVVHISVVRERVYVDIDFYESYSGKIISKVLRIFFVY